MSTISNRFFVTAIEDGSTLHGNLRATKSLSQAWKQGQCEPNWTAANPIVESDQPIIFLSLMSGDQYVLPDVEPVNGVAAYTWEYNGNTLTFDTSTHKNQAISGVIPANVFMTSSKTVNGLQMPALVIIGNLASSENVDLDVITFRGKKTISSAPVPFSATIEVRITEWVNGGYLGTLTFQDGITDITADNDSVTITPALYNDNGYVPNKGSAWTVKWYLNDTQVTTTDTSASAYVVGNGNNALDFVVKEPAVVDYATVRCEFYTVEGLDETLVFTTYEGIDDTQDPEYMYVEYATGSGNAASLHSGESVTFHIWVASMTDPAPSGGWSYKVKLLDAQGEVYTANITDIPNADASGYRTLEVYSSGTDVNKAHIAISYNVVTTLGKAITGLIQATTTTNS